MALWSKTKLRRLPLLLLLLLLSVVSEAFGGASKAFSQHISDAQHFYTDKKYDNAITQFELAYEIDPEPLILLSIGRCHYLAGRPKEALSYYNRALQGKLSRSEREEVTASVAKATIKFQEQEQQLAEERRAADRAKFEAIVASTTVAQPHATEQKPIYKSGLFWGLIGGNVAVIGLSIGLGLGLRNKSTPPTDPIDQIPTIGMVP